MIALTLLSAGFLTGRARAASIPVNTLADVVSAVDGQCSLREAITAANSGLPSGGVAGECPAGSPFPTGDSIQFTLPGLIVISPALGPLPAISGGRTLIDGWSAPGALPGRPPRVAIDGNLLGLGNGLTVTSRQNAIRGLAVARFDNVGIRIEGGLAVANRVYGNAIGTNPRGTIALGNDTGVSIASGAVDNIIGTNGDGNQDRAERNVISGNLHTGVSVTGAGTTANRIAGNYIGTNRRGTQALPNGIDGIGLGVSADGNIIGTDSSGDAFDADEGNLISGNGQSGINQFGGIGNTVVAGNLIGLRADGLGALPNLLGIQILDSVVGMRIGTDGDGVADDAERNVISGNTVVGVDARGQDHLIAGNFIGTDVSGTAAVPNGIGISADLGPLLLGGPMTIGGPDKRFRNVISGNGGTGVTVIATGVEIQCNFIGTDVNGAVALPNVTGINVTAGLDATVIENRISHNTVGLTSGEPLILVQDNIFEGNSQDGFSWGDPGSQDVVDNWWGDASGPTHPGNPGGLGDSILESMGGTVFYNPWLLAEPDLCLVP